MIGKHHATMAQFLTCLKLEQNFNEVLISQFNAGNDIGAPKRKKYVNYNKRIKRVVSSYDSDHVLEYLRNIAACIEL